MNISRKQLMLIEEGLISVSKVNKSLIASNPDSVFKDTQKELDGLLLTINELVNTKEVQGDSIKLLYVLPGNSVKIEPTPVDKPDELLSPSDYQRAVDVQNASNISGIVNSFKEALTKIRNSAKSTGNYNSRYINTHSICKMYSEKLYDLSDARYTSFSDFYGECKQGAQVDVKTEGVE